MQQQYLPNLQYSSRRVIVNFSRQSVQYGLGLAQEDPAGHWKTSAANTAAAPRAGSRRLVTCRDLHDLT